MPLVASLTAQNDAQRTPKQPRNTAKILKQFSICTICIAVMSIQLKIQRQLAASQFRFQAALKHGSRRYSLPGNLVRGQENFSVVGGSTRRAEVPGGGVSWGVTRMRAVQCARQSIDFSVAFRYRAKATPEL